MKITDLHLIRISSSVTSWLCYRNQNLDVETSQINSIQIFPINNRIRAYLAQKLISPKQHNRSVCHKLRASTFIILPDSKQKVNTHHKQFLTFLYLFDLVTYQLYISD